MQVGHAQFDDALVRGEIGGNLPQIAVEPLKRLREERGNKLVSAGKISVEGSGTEVRAAGDLAEAERLRADLEQQLPGGHQYLFSCAQTPAVTPGQT